MYYNYLNMSFFSSCSANCQPSVAKKINHTFLKSKILLLFIWNWRCLEQQSCSFSWTSSGKWSNFTLMHRLLHWQH